MQPEVSMRSALQPAVTWCGNPECSTTGAAARFSHHQSISRGPTPHQHEPSPVAGAGRGLAVDAVQPHPQRIQRLSGVGRHHHLHRLGGQVVAKVGCRE